MNSVHSFSQCRPLRHSVLNPQEGLCARNNLESIASHVPTAILTETFLVFLRPSREIPSKAAPISPTIFFQTFSYPRTTILPATLCSLRQYERRKTNRTVRVK